ncbi:chemokine XC receptor 1 [Paramisgurnus dabryanus]|uniref:chemokine XC receptor 1 n=1 Tax=Paramisgurnus dabryanus TaxID=90735 RepID=UPI0031F4031C
MAHNSTYEQNYSYDYNSSYEYQDDLTPLCELYDAKKPTAMCYATIFCISIIGNGFLLFSLTCYEDLKRPTNLFILCLTLFDLLFTLTLPFWCVEFLHHWVFGDVTCKIMTGAYFVGIYGSLMLLTAMTLDRFAVVVVRGDWFRGDRRLRCARTTCAGAWIIGLIASMRDSMASKAQKDFDSFFCESTHTEDDKVGYYTQLVLFFLVPFVLIVFCYTKILLTLMSTANRQKHKTVILVLSIVIAFFVCWGPYHILIVMMSYYDPCKYYRLYIAFVICRILAFSHCCMNPVLYFLRAKFRPFVSRLFCCSPELGRNRGTTDLSDIRTHGNTNERDFENCVLNSL